MMLDIIFGAMLFFSCTFNFFLIRQHNSICIPILNHTFQNGNINKTGLNGLQSDSNFPSV